MKNIIQINSKTTAKLICKYNLHFFTQNPPRILLVKLFNKQLTDN